MKYFYIEFANDGHIRAIHKTKPSNIETLEIYYDEILIEKINNIGCMRYKYANNELVLDNELISKMEMNNIKNIFREFRENKFKLFDILKTNIAVGLAMPLTDEEKQWYNDMLNFTENISLDTTPADYPVTPERLK